MKELAFTHPLGDIEAPDNVAILLQLINKLHAHHLVLLVAILGPVLVADLLWERLGIHGLLCSLTTSALLR